jgi:hypothetical protein
MAMLLRMFREKKHLNCADEFKESRGTQFSLEEINFGRVTRKDELVKFYTV